MGRRTNLRSSVQRGQKKRKSGGWGGSWRDRLNIPRAETIDFILTRGEYADPNDLDDKGKPRKAPFHTCKVHGVKYAFKGKDSYYVARCNIDHMQATEGHDKTNCLHCKLKVEGDRRVGLKELYSFNVIHLGLYERVPLKDRDGKTRRHEDGDKRGQPIMVWETVDKPKRRRQIKEDIDDLLDDGSVRMFAKKYIEVGSGHRDDLVLADDKAAAHCKCGGSIEYDAFECEECEEMVLDVEEEDMTAAEAQQFREERHECDSCGHVGFPVGRPVCDSCDEPDPLTIFDVVIRARKEGTGTKTRISIEKVIPLGDYQLPNEEYLIEFEEEDGEFFPVEDDDGNFVFVEEGDLKKIASAPWDFERVHAPKDHGWVANRLGVENPWPESGESRYRRYGDDDNGKSKSRVRNRDADGDGGGGGEEKESRGRRGRGGGGRRGRSSRR